MGPGSGGCLTTGELAGLFCQSWGGNARWEEVSSDGPHEDAILRLDCEKIRSSLGWSPRWDIRRAVEEVVVWTKSWLDGEDPFACIVHQARTYFTGSE